MINLIKLRKRNRIRTKNILYNGRKNTILNNFAREKYKLVLLLISIFGILLGAICYKITDNSQLAQIIAGICSTINSGDFKLIFFCLFKLDFICFLISFFIGTSFIGSVLSFIPPAVKCLYIGYLGGYLYNEFELKGVLFCLLLLYPCFAITTTSLIFASNENVYMSKYIYNCLNGKSTTDNISIRLYLLRYILLITVTITGIVVASFLISFIGPKINIM